MARTRQIRVDESDVELMETSCVKLFLQEHPELKGSHVTQRQMFAQLVNYYLE